MIDQRRCKYIKTIADCHSFSKAAQQLYVSQPSLSRFVKKVEEELNIELFDRETIPITLTSAGKKYLDYVEQFQQLESQMRVDFAAMNTGMISQLSIATLPFLGTYVLPKIVPNFANLYPSVDLQIEETNSRELLQRVEDGQADL
ncbi:MAG: LysR family transcriptional regulator, partial [Pygmaiobacter sp.]